MRKPRRELNSYDFLWSYFDHLKGADIDGAVNMFEEDGYLQHSNGHRYTGKDELRVDFINMFKANGGKIEVKLSNFMDDGERRVVELYMPSGRPRVAIYERGKNNKLAALRISL